MPRRSYNDSEIERGLVAVALESANTRRASELLARHGLKISRRTLHRWHTSLYPDRYATVREEILPKLRAHLVEKHTELARRQLCVSHKLLARIEAEMDDLPIRDVATALRNLDVGSGIHTDKATDLRSDSSMVVQRGSSIPQILQAIQTQFPGVLRVNPALLEPAVREVQKKEEDVD